MTKKLSGLSIFMPAYNEEGNIDAADEWVARSGERSISAVVCRSVAAAL